jgi:hypothetical protein
MRLTTTTLPGETITAIGYGQKDVQQAGRFERADVEILSVGPSTIYPEGANSYPRTFSVGPAVCPGDSGGPALSGSKAVLGVFSLIRGDCLAPSVRNFYTQLAPYASFIEQAFADSGFEPVDDAPPTTTTGGAAGAAGETSADGGSAATSVGATGAMGSGGSGGGNAGSGGTSSDSTTASSTTSGFIGGRRKPKDGCNCGVAGEASWLGGASPLFVAIIGLLRRRSRFKKQTPSA